MTAIGEPTLYAVVRTLERMDLEQSRRDTELNRRLAELAQSLAQMVTRDLHEAHRAALLDDIAELRAQLQAERDRQANNRRQVVGAFLAAGLSLLVTIITSALLIALKLNP